MFDDEYEDRMHDIRQDERQEKPVSDAAQVIAEIIRIVDGDHTMGAAALGEAIATRLSETHAVVELPEPQSTFEGNDDENGWQLWASPLGEGPLLFEDGELHYLGVTTYDMKKPETLAASLLACARTARAAEATQ